jgi:folate-binding protein YgfZ
MAIPNPLHALHEAANAEFQPYGPDLQIPLTFGLPQAEYAAIHKSCAITDNPQRAFLELTGKDRHPFLNNLLTNQTYNKDTKQPLAPHTGVYAFLLNTKGRITTDLNVLELPDRTLLELDARLLPAIESFLNKYLFADQVKITSLLGKLHLLSLHGPQSINVLAQHAPDPAPLRNLSYLTSTQITLADVPVTIYRDDACNTPGYHLIIPTESAAALWSALAPPPSSILQPPPSPAPLLPKPTGWAAFNSARIEAGRPLFGIDFDDTILPAETSQFNRAVSTTKGCYLGQEIVARMHARNQVPKLLVGLRMNADALPLAGSPIMDNDGNTVGVVTSSTLSPILSNAAIALGYVKKPLYTPGTPLQIPAEGALHPATIVETPFVK